MTHWTSWFHNTLWFHFKACIIFILKMVGFYFGLPASRRIGLTIKVMR